MSTVCGRTRPSCMLSSASAGLMALLLVAAQPAAAVWFAGPREIRLIGQFVASEGGSPEKQPSLTLVLPDQENLFLAGVEVRDLSGDIPGSTIYYNDFGTTGYRLDVVGPNELLTSLRQSARAGVRASMLAQYYRSVGRLRILEVGVLDARE